MKLLYSILKLFPVKNKILFCSRQHNGVSTDYRLIQEEIRKRNSEVEIVNLCKRFQNRKDGTLSFGIIILRSMYHLATSKVCILDGYWPPVCILKHKKNLTVIQIWHSIGKIKKSGYQTLDTEYGRSRKMAELLCMHKNYDYIITGGKAWNPYYRASFNAEEKVLRNYGLPRVDELIRNEKFKKKKFLSAYPEMKTKKIVLYAPTFRKNEPVKWQGIAECFAKNKDIAFICKLHPNDKQDCKTEGVYTCDDFSTMDIMPACDCLITDYSSIALEGAAINKEIYYYVYDMAEYSSKNGLNVNMYDMMPAHTSGNPEEIYELVTKKEYDYKELENYKEKFLPENIGHATEKIVNLIEENLC